MKPVSERMHGTARNMHEGVVVFNANGLAAYAEEVAQLEDSLKEIRNVANQVHNEADTELVPLWVMEKCTKALGDQREWLAFLGDEIEKELGVASSDNPE